MAWCPLKRVSSGEGSHLINSLNYWESRGHYKSL